MVANQVIAIAILVTLYAILFALLFVYAACIGYAIIATWVRVAVAIARGEL